MQLEYHTSSLTSGIKGAYERLLPGHEQVIASGKLEWKFKGSPAGEALVSIAQTDGVVVGMIGTIPLRLRVRDRVLVAIQAIDGVVDPRMRGKGCFTMMARQLHSAAQGSDLDGIFGFPNQNAAPTWFSKLGWSRLGRAPFLFKPLRTGFFTRRLFPAAMNYPLAFPRRSCADIRRITAFDEQIDELWRRFAGTRFCAVERTRGYMNWRLINCPSAIYDCYGSFVRDELRSFVATHTADKHGGKIGYVMEALGDHTLPNLLEDAVARLKADGVEVVLAWCLRSSPNRQSYSRAGFLPLPSHFSPEINFGACAFSAPAEPITNCENWYLSYLDSDSV